MASRRHPPVGWPVACYLRESFYWDLLSLYDFVSPHRLWALWGPCSVRFSHSVVSDSKTPWTATWQASLSNESAVCIRWQKYWSFSFNINPSNEGLWLTSYAEYQETFAGFLPTVQFSSVAQSCPTLCYPVNHSMPGLPVHHQLPGFTQTHVHWVGDAIQPPHPLSSPSPPAFSLSQHQGLFQWVSSSHQVEFQLQYQSFQWTLRTDPL